MKNSLVVFCLLLQAAASMAQGNTDTVHVVRKTSQNRISATGFIVPAVLLTYGGISQNTKALKDLDYDINSKIEEKYPDFRIRIDDYLQFAPAAAVYALDKFYIKSKNNFTDRTILFLISNVTSSIFVCILKSNIDSWRPDKSSHSTFPSGHTATAFTNAEFLHQEYKGNCLITTAGYLTAATTGTLRLFNHKHYLSDIVAGAGIGMASTKLAYLVYPVIKRTFFRKKDKVTAVKDL